MMGGGGVYSFPFMIQWEMEMMDGIGSALSIAMVGCQWNDSIVMCMLSFGVMYIPFPSTCHHFCSHYTIYCQSIGVGMYRLSGRCVLLGDWSGSVVDGND